MLMALVPKPVYKALQCKMNKYKMVLSPILREEEYPAVKNEDLISFFISLSPVPLRVIHEKTVEKNHGHRSDQDYDLYFLKKVVTALYTSATDIWCLNIIV